MPRSRSNNRRRRSPCAQGQIRRKSDGKCLSPRSKQGKFVLRARKAANTRRSRSRSGGRRVRSYKGMKYSDFPSMPPMKGISPCIKYSKVGCSTQPDCIWQKRRGCIRKPRNRIEYWLSQEEKEMIQELPKVQEQIEQSNKKILKQEEEVKEEMEKVKELAEDLEDDVEAIEVKVMKAPMELKEQATKELMEKRKENEKKIQQAYIKVKEEEDKLEDVIEEEKQNVQAQFMKEIESRGGLRQVAPVQKVYQAHDERVAGLEQQLEQTKQRLRKTPPLNRSLSPRLEQQLRLRKTPLRNRSPPPKEKQTIPSPPMEEQKEDWSIFNFKF